MAEPLGGLLIAGAPLALFSSDSAPHISGGVRRSTTIIIINIRHGGRAARDGDIDRK